jgi:TolB-like protein/DNA-binding winged helix-turn-helix (wHTH) protein/Tfp pilus assembly protein PilF
VAEKKELSPSRVLRFGVFQVNLAARELRKHGVHLRLPAQPFCILSILLEKPGEVITREEMRQRLWAADTFVDFEHSLNTAIKKLRGALGDSPENSRYIETVPRVGYRFVAPVEEVAVDRPLPAAAPVGADHIEAPSLPGGSSHLRWAVGFGIFMGLIAAVGIYIQWSHHWLRPPPSAGRTMLAVLPFENLTGDASQDYFSDGLTEEMIAQLGRLDPEHVGVIARTSVMHYKHSQGQLEQISRELGVQYVLEGSVRRDSNKVRITAQLIQMKDQTNLWSRVYDRELSNVSALRSEIAFEVVDEIRLTLGGAKSASPPLLSSSSPRAYEAYDLYFKGLYFWNKRNVLGFQQAIEYFQQAIAIDPNYAPAYAGLANSYTLLTAYSSASAALYIPQARAAALRALEIDEKLPEAHTALALIVQNHDWDWQTSEKEYRRAIELNPNYATAHHWYAEHLMWLGRFDEALVESERARQLDPLSLIIATDNGAILYFSRRYDRAIEQFRAVLEKDRNFGRAGILTYPYVEKGMFSEALAEAQIWRRFYGEGPWYWSNMAYIYGRSGQQGRARREVEKLEKLNRRQQLDPVTMLWAHLGLGNKDEALADLEKAYSEHLDVLTTLKVEPAFDPLRSDPRFQDLLRRVGLADSGVNAGNTPKR